MSKTRKVRVYKKGGAPKYQKAGNVFGKEIKTEPNRYNNPHNTEVNSISQFHTSDDNGVSKNNVDNIGMQINTWDPKYNIPSDTTYYRNIDGNEYFYNTANENEKSNEAINKEILNTFYKKGGESFKPHMMYNPETGEGTMANVYQDHLEMKNMGYGHEPIMYDGGNMFQQGGPQEQMMQQPGQEQMMQGQPQQPQMSEEEAQQQQQQQEIMMQVAQLLQQGTKPEKIIKTLVKELELEEAQAIQIVKQTVEMIKQQAQQMDPSIQQQQPMMEEGGNAFMPNEEEKNYFEQKSADFVGLVNKTSDIANIKNDLEQIGLSPKQIKKGFNTGGAPGPGIHYNDFRTEDYGYKGNPFASLYESQINKSQDKLYDNIDNVRGFVKNMFNAPKQGVDDQGRKGLYKENVAGWNGYSNNVAPGTTYGVDSQGNESSFAPGANPYMKNGGPNIPTTFDEIMGQAATSRSTYGPDKINLGYSTDVDNLKIDLELLKKQAEDPNYVTTPGTPSPIQILEEYKKATFEQDDNAPTYWGTEVNENDGQIYESSYHPLHDNTKALHNEAAAWENLIPFNKSKKGKVDSPGEVPVRFQGGGGNPIKPIINYALRSNKRWPRNKFMSPKGNYNLYLQGIKEGVNFPLGDISIVDDVIEGLNVNEGLEGIGIGNLLMNAAAQQKNIGVGLRPSEFEAYTNDLEKLYKSKINPKSPTHLRRFDHTIESQGTFAEQIRLNNLSKTGLTNLKRTVNLLKEEGITLSEGDKYILNNITAEAEKFSYSKSSNIFDSIEKIENPIVKKKIGEQIKNIMWYKKWPLWAAGATGVGAGAYALWPDGESEEEAAKREEIKRLEHDIMYSPYDPNSPFNVDTLPDGTITNFPVRQKSYYQDGGPWGTYPVAKPTGIYQSIDEQDGYMQAKDFQDSLDEDSKLLEIYPEWEQEGQIGITPGPYVDKGLFNNKRQFNFQMDARDAEGNVLTDVSPEFGSTTLKKDRSATRAAKKGWRQGKRDWRKEQRAEHGSRWSNLSGHEKANTALAGLTTLDMFTGAKDRKQQQDDFYDQFDASNMYISQAADKGLVKGHHQKNVGPTDLNPYDTGMGSFGNFGNISKFGGTVGDEVYMDEDELKNFLDGGGLIEYLD